MTAAAQPSPCRTCAALGAPDCGRDAHEHYRDGTDCAVHPACPGYRPPWLREQVRSWLASHRTQR